MKQVIKHKEDYVKDLEGMMESREQFKIEKKLRNEIKDLKQQLCVLRKREAHSKAKTANAISHNDTSIDSELKNRSFHSKKKIDKPGSVRTLFLTLDIKKNHLKKELGPTKNPYNNNTIKEENHNRFSDLSREERE